MNRRLAITSLGLLFLSGCPEAAPGTGSSGSLANAEAATWEAGGMSRKAADTGSTVSVEPGRTVAVLNGAAITMEQLQRPLLEAHGVQFLLLIARNECYRQKAREGGIAITPKDIAAERRRMLDQVFQDSVPLDSFRGGDDEKRAARLNEMERLLPQVLNAKRVSLAEFGLAAEGGATLWKIAESEVMKQITEDALRKVFRIKYGEKIRVRDIQVSNLREATEVQRRLAAGEAFDKVAMAMSQDKSSREFGGELRPFTRAEPTLSEAFKEAAFALKDGEVSAPINAGDAYHVIKAEDHIPPQVVKYEDHKDSIREELANLMTSLRVQQLRQSFDAEVRGSLRIEDPILRRRYQQMLEQAGGSGQDLNTVRRNIGHDNQPSTGVTVSPGSEVAQPPATRPGN
ncbi:MAG: peptidylprolyl isomerase [Tepidisphaeraceae bacterium]